MRIDIHPDAEKAGFYRITPHGSIDSDTYQEFQSKVNPVVDAKTKGILIDLEQCEYISSAGLSVLFNLKKALLANKGELLFCNLKPQIKRLFEIVKALPKETLFGSIEEADRYFYKIMNEEIAKQKGAKQG